MPRKDAKEEAKPAKKNVIKEMEDYIAEESPESDYAASGAHTATKTSLKRTKSGQAYRERPKKRCLIRWNEVYDQRTLLALQHVLNKKGIKIPWDEVGTELGPTITEGYVFSGHLAPSYVFAGALRHVTEAVHPRNMSSSPKPIEYGNADSEVTDRAIVQHLAKLRNRLDAEGVKVTPPLKRGGRATSIVPNAKAGNNNKTVSAKGSVAKRSGKFKTRAKQGHVNKEDDDEESDSEDAATRQGKGKSWYKKDKGQSGQVKVKAEQSDEGLKFSRGRGPKAEYDDDVSEHSIEDDDYQSDYEAQYENQTVAINAPFLELERSDKSSVASRVSSTSTPRKLVILPIGRAMAETLGHHDGNAYRGDSQYTRHASSCSNDGSAIAYGSPSNEFGSIHRQDQGGRVSINTSYGGGSNEAFEQDSFNFAVPAFPAGSIKKKKPENQPKFAGYGMQGGPFDQTSSSGNFGNDIGFGGGFQYGSGEQCHGLPGQGYQNTGLQSGASGYGFPVGNQTASYSDMDALRFSTGKKTPISSSAGNYGHPYESNVGFPVSNERHHSRSSAVRSNQYAYAHSPQAELGHSNFGDLASMDPFDDVDPNFDINDPSLWGMMEESNNGYAQGS